MLICLAYIFSITYFLTCLHYFQWKGYFYTRYLKYLFKNKNILIINLNLFLIIILNIIKILKNSVLCKNLIILLFLINILILFIFLFKKKKIKFKFTNKIFRLFSIYIFLLLFTVINKNVIIFTVIFIPILLILSDILDYYKYIQDNKCINNAMAKLEQNKNLITIGITGSNGKTTIKEILYKILSTKYKVSTTIKNQNTPKGAIIALNNLTQDTEIFICEMGARKRGDIKKMCNIVNPTYGIISTVSPQHLETFKTEENIYQTKKELPDYLKNNYCVFNIDNPLTLKMYTEKQGEKSAISITKKCLLYATNIHVVNFQTYFDINYNGLTYPCHTHLLGEHNVINILLALQLAIKLGVDLNNAIQAIVNLSPTPHRLEYVKSHIDIIDDSYNCSIDSAKMALKVLSQIPKNKIVCTPGIIEGGKQQFDLNCKLSLMLSKVADVIIIVGKTNKKALIKNLDDFKIFNITTNKTLKHLSKTIYFSIDELNNPIKKKSAYIVNNLNTAQKLFSKILNKEDVLLLLNDLPDEYN